MYMNNVCLRLVYIHKLNQWYTHCHNSILCGTALLNDVLLGLETQFSVTGLEQDLWKLGGTVDPPRGVCCFTCNELNQWAVNIYIYILNVWFIFNQPLLGCVWFHISCGMLIDIRPRNWNGILYIIAEQLLKGERDLGDCNFGISMLIAGKTWRWMLRWECALRYVLYCEGAW